MTFVNIFVVITDDFPGFSFISVPLAELWSCCPRICELSGSLGNLRHLLMEEPDVKLSQDGSAVLVKYPDQGTFYYFV